MKAGIAGAGSLGSLFASFFIRAGIDTAVYEKSPETVSLMKQGLIIRDNGSGELLYPDISDNPLILCDADIVFLFVKSYSTTEVMESISPVLGEKTVIVSLQNGLGNFELINGFVPAERIVYGTTTFGAAKASPAEVIFGGRGTVNIGGASMENVEITATLLRTAGCEVHVSESPERIVWMKAIVNAGINPVASILGIKNGEIPENSYASKLQEELVREAVGAAATRGIAFDFGQVLAETRSICMKTAQNTCSMLQDIRAGRRTEIESINLKIAEFAQAAGLDLKYNRSVSLIIKAMETKAR